MHSDLGPCRYSIDAQDRIASVDDNWLRFAQSNGATDMTAEHVVGTSLWRHVHGEPLTAIYRHLFAVLRSQRQELALPFRCDSPALVRHMVMTMRTSRSGQIDFQVRLLRTEERAPIDWLAGGSGAGSAETMAICSMCRRVWLEDQWVELTRAVVSARMASSPVAPQLKEAVCDNCMGLSDQASATARSKSQ